MTKTDEFVFLPLGGVGEIGMNLALYGYGKSTNRQWIIVDCGVTFPGSDLPGVDLVLPDIRYLLEERDNIKGMIITHAHEDHYGAIADLWPMLEVPLYMTPFTHGMLEAKFAYERQTMDFPINIFNAGESFKVGPFSIDAIAVNHSIPEPVSLAITTELGTAIHTGDWKIDEAPSMMPKSDEQKFEDLGDKGVLALICDSTNAMREGVSPSEQEVSASLRKIIEESKGRVAVTTFSSNVGRIRSIAKAATDAGRKVLLLGSSIRRVVDVADGLDYMEGIAPFIQEDEFATIERNKVVIILTGSQGEARAALAKISRGEMKNVSLSSGDKVIFSSRSIPGNEKPILDVMNGLIEQGIEIITDADRLVHVSGHPRRNELQQMYKWTRPETLVPVHGEAAHLTAHRKLGQSAGISHVPRVRNGDMLRLAPGIPEVIDEAPHGRIFKDGRLIGDLEEMGITARRKLSYVGQISVNVLLNKNNELVRDPLIAPHGVPQFDGDGRDIADLMRVAAIGAVESIPRARRKDLDTVRESVRRSVRAIARDLWGKKPVMTVFITKL